MCIRKILQYLKYSKRESLEKSSNAVIIKSRYSIVKQMSLIRPDRQIVGCCVQEEVDCLKEGISEIGIDEFGDLHDYSETGVLFLKFYNEARRMYTILVNRVRSISQ